MFRVLPIAVLALFLWAVPAQADSIIEFTASGLDADSGDNYWGVEFVSGPGFVQSVTFDLSTHPQGVNATFDFDGSGNYMGATGPVVNTTVGLAAGDITPSFVGQSPQVLTFDFAPGSFEAGDSFNFAADIELLWGDTGADVAGATAMVVMESLWDGESLFSVTGNTTSTARIQFDAQGNQVRPTPEPGTAALVGLGALGAAWRRRRRRLAAA